MVEEILEPCDISVTFVGKDHQLCPIVAWPPITPKTWCSRARPPKVGGIILFLYLIPRITSWEILPNSKILELFFRHRFFPSPPEHLKRIPGPKALLYYLPRDEALRSGGFRLPRSTRTIWQILDTAGLIERETPGKHAPLPLQEVMQEVQMDFKDVTTAIADPTSPTGKRQHLIEACHFVDAGSSRLLSAQVHDDFHAETAFDAVVAFLREYGLPDMLTMDRDVCMDYPHRNPTPASTS